MCPDLTQAAISTFSIADGLSMSDEERIQAGGMTRVGVQWITSFDVLFPDPCFPSVGVSAPTQNGYHGNVGVKYLVNDEIRKTAR